MSVTVEIPRRTYLARLKASSIRPARLLTERTYEVNQEKMESLRIKMAESHIRTDL